jgi:hypothetical protein
MRQWLKGMLAGVAALAAVAGMASTAGAAICGDLSGNGAVTTGDATILLQVVGGVHPNPASLCGGLGALQCGDLNANGSLDPADVTILLRTINGLPTTFAPCTGVGTVVACGATLPNTITSNRQIQKCGGCDTACSAFVNGTTFVNAGVTLSVQAGATVCGVKGAATPSVLVFQRDAKINAPGLPCEPIVFTSDQAPGARGISDWGGLVFNGRAPVNCVVGGVGINACLSEGLSGVEFGGTDPNDSSGILRYARIEFSGIELSADNELNVLTQNGLGRGTQFDHIQASNGFDDGFEWFGGTIREKFLVSTGNADDNLDTQIGYTGANQFALVIQRAGAVQAGGGHGGYEWDNNENAENGLPRNAPIFCNGTVIGAKAQGDATAGRVGALLRRGTAGIIANNIIMDWPGGGVELNGSNAATQACTTGALDIRDTLFFSNGAAGDLAATGSGNGGTCTGDIWYDTILTGHGVDPATSPNAGTNPGITTGAYPVAITNQFVPAAAIPALNAPDCKTLQSDFFDTAAYKGAFVPGGGAAANWLNSCPAPAAGQCQWISFATN